MKMTRPVAGWFTLTVDENDWNRGAEAFLNELKRMIPHAHREYDPGTKVWSIKEIFYSDVRRLSDEYFAIPNHDLFESTSE